MRKTILEIRSVSSFRRVTVLVRWSLLILPAVLIGDTLATGETGRDEDRSQATWEKLAPHFRPPPELADDLGEFRSLLTFDFSSSSMC
jgi:hypothetical protein